MKVKDRRNLKPPKGRKTLKFYEFQKQSMLNSDKLPEFVDIGGKRKQWVGIGWVDCGPAQGDEVIITEDDGTLPYVKVPRDEQVEFWARCQFYEPFTMGGSVWQWVRYQTKGFLRTASGYEVYVAMHYDDLYSVYEADTGGHICDAETMQKAVAKARRLISITPDFDTQIKAMQPIEKLRVVEAEDAIRRLKKSIKKEESVA